MFKQHKAYVHDVKILTSNADRLAQLLDAQPDPVRGQLVTEQIYRNVGKISHPSLMHQRDTMLAAADAALYWTLGTSGKDRAVAALDQANQTITKAIEAYSE
ncbi:MAG: hypothetical protein U9Q82_07205 [Chloroflexota bacterium]|nr:hypothetical protein [Chloroflexota bacterium]